MNCESVLDHAAAYLDGSLDGPVREAVVRHLESCADCRGLVEALARAGAAAGAPGEPDLAGAVLARTTGAACGSARSLLCGRVDGELEPFDAELVDRHLLHCPDCEGLARALRQMQADLPRLREADPGLGFVEGVLARTSRRPRVASLSERFAGAASRWLDRPRIALEGAFGLALAVGLLSTLFPSSLPGGTMQALAGLRGAWGEIEGSFRVGARDAWATTESFVVERSAAVAASLSRRSTDVMESFRPRYGTFPEPRASGQESAGSGRFDQVPEGAQENRR
jgi:predicted anti-sigma-YlaC factor YlaD